MRLIATAIALVVAYIVASSVLAAVLDDERSPIRFGLALVLSAIAGTVAFTAMKDGRKGFVGLFERR